MGAMVAPRACMARMAGPSHERLDDTYVYWADMTTVGTIMKAPKAGGGTATVLARDTNPTAIAVDANSVYWGDQGGYIKRTSPATLWPPMYRGDMSSRFQPASPAAMDSTA
jgi:hypothetical protein